jgi:hypothetical protein
MDEFRKAMISQMMALIPDQVTTAQVVSVDEVAFTCEVLLLPDEGLVLPDVRLVPSIGEAAAALVVIPAIDSLVLVGVINNNLLSSYVISCQSASKIIMMGGDLGGMAKVQELKEQLHYMTLRLDKCIEYIKKAQTASLQPNLAWPTAAALAFDALTKESFDDIENERVTHG